jgi:hypothetical protein
MPTRQFEFGGEAIVSATISQDGDNPNEAYLDDMELESLHLFDRDWSEKELRVYFGDMGADALIGLIFDAAGEDLMEWEE